MRETGCLNQCPEIPAEYSNGFAKGSRKHVPGILWPGNGDRPQTESRPVGESDRPAFRTQKEVWH